MLFPIQSTAIETGDQAPGKLKYKKNNIDNKNNYNTKNLLSFDIEIIFN